VIWLEKLMPTTNRPGEKTLHLFCANHHHRDHESKKPTTMHRHGTHVLFEAKSHTNGERPVVVDIKHGITVDVFACEVCGYVELYAQPEEE